MKKNTQKLTALILTFALLLTLLPAAFAPLPQTQASEKPIWKVAFITIPEVKVQVGSESNPRVLTRTTVAPVGRATLFKNFIEESAGHAVDIQVTSILAEEKFDFVSSSSSFINVHWDLTRLTSDMIEKYGLAEFDTWVVWWPFTNAAAGPDNLVNYNANRNANGGMAAMALSEREIYIPLNMGTGGVTLTSQFGTVLNGRQYAAVEGTLIHEFLHTT